ncbi:uncharacterized protein BCR38DRAFT_373516 [Pseudomassariella vexata]|uniref:L-ornithine N(5)-oxygenase n=1 Tax=Pseudomassariella vexata TaxID=1141098 RepID=A0A1Y2DQX1_9PEZI|nr:uncharacterized protein BCR38DRAFT_373516 [Pseudomassariella vexata]ORY61579.1 hypothetical protein BCR38DRAFT_373516 [Pseudomassariella vexata]
MAKAYLEASPIEDSNILIVDYASSIGGTWATERLYPDLKTNNIVGSYEFSDYPMDLQRYCLKPHQHIPGTVVHRYLSDFAEHYGLTPRMQLRTRVEAANLQEDGSWIIEFSTNGPDRRETLGRLVASKLVLATGLTSEPYMPVFSGQEIFKGHIFHSKQFKNRIDQISSSQKVVVIGGNKSAWDVCYAAARFGAKVHIIMRPSGGGPSHVWRPIRVLGLETSLSRLSLTRLFTWVDPNPFGSAGKTARWLLHQNSLGRKICLLFWGFLDQYICRTNGYDEVDSQVRMMKPWTSTFWMGNSLSIHNYETDWFQLVRDGQITPHVAEVLSLTETLVQLSDGTSIEVDALVCCTGWKFIPAIKFSPEWAASEIFGGNLDSEVAKDVRSEVLQRCPVLKSAPIRKLPPGTPSGKDASMGPNEAQSLRLCRFMVPTSPRLFQKRNVAFIGAHLSIHAVMLAQVQALWIVAFFQDKLSLDVEDQNSLAFDTALHSEYEKLRRPKEAGGTGNRFPDLVFDSLPYVDMVLGDLGMRAKRKGSWWKDVFSPYSLADYKGLVQEWLALVTRKNDGAGPNQSVSS